MMDSFIISILIKPQQSISNSYGHCGVICKLRFFAEEREVLALIASVKFIRRTNHVAEDCSDHNLDLLHLMA